ncbi:MAG: VPLPA-CTERM sorting domain-containing protein [Pseudomonadota bacterium]
MNSYALRSAAALISVVGLVCSGGAMAASVVRSGSTSFRPDARFSIERDYSCESLIDFDCLGDREKSAGLFGSETERQLLIVPGFDQSLGTLDSIRIVLDVGPAFLRVTELGDDITGGSDDDVDTKGSGSATVTARIASLGLDGTLGSDDQGGGNTSVGNKRFERVFPTRSIQRRLLEPFFEDTIILALFTTLSIEDDSTLNCTFRRTAVTRTCEGGLRMRYVSSSSSTGSARPLRVDYDVIYNFTPAPIAPVPLPASGILFLAALGGAGTLLRCRKAPRHSV